MSTTIFFDKVIVTSVDSTTSRVMLGGSVSDLNNGLTNPEGQTLVPAGGEQNTLPQLTATAYLAGVALSPQPNFRWSSSNPGVVQVSQSGICARTTPNLNVSSFDSNGGVSVGQLGGTSNIRAEALRPDNSPGGVFGEITIAVQAAAARQYVSGSTHFAANTYGATGFFNLVQD